MRKRSLQERYAPSSVCFGCGPANKHGLRIRSFVEGDVAVAKWKPSPYHHAFGRFLNGGIISTVLDCHSNWTAAYALMTGSGAKSPPPTVTASITVEFIRPTPIAPLMIEARASSVQGRKVTVESTLKSEGVVTAKLRGTFVMVGAGHPASYRWSGGKGREPTG